MHYHFRFRHVTFALILALFVTTVVEGQDTQDLMQSIERKIEYAQGIARTDRMQAMDSLLSAYQAALLLNDPQYLAMAHKALAGNYRLADSYDSAIKYYELAKAYWLDQKNELEVASIQNQLGVVWRYTGAYEKALEYYDEALKVFKEWGQTKSTAIVYRQKAIVKKRQYKFQEALALYLQAKDLAEQLGDKILLADCYNGISGVYKAQKEYIKARTMLHQSLAIFEELNDAVGLANVLNNIGELYLRTNDFDSAIVYLDRSYVYGHRMEMRNALGINLFNKGLALRELQQYEEAVRAFDESSKLFVEIGNRRSAIYPAMAKTELYRLQGQLLEARVNLELTLPIAMALGDQLVIRNLYETLYEIQKEQSDFEGALKSLEKHNVYKDSIFDEERSQQLIDIEVKYETERKEQEIASLSQENQIKALRLSQQRFVIGFVIVLSILIGFMAWVAYTRYRDKTETNKLLLEQRLLRSQMNPHFIYNAMSSIQNLVLSDKKDKANTYLSRFGELTRNILDSSRQEFITLDRELALVQDYVYLENLRFDKSIEFVANVHDDPETLLVPPMITQPFVENAFKHGFEHDTEGKIELNVRKEANILIFELMDNGRGLQKEALDKSKSLAIKITKERLSGLIKGVTKPLDIFDRLDDQGQVLGVSVKLSLPIKHAL